MTFQITLTLPEFFPQPLCLEEREGALSHIYLCEASILQKPSPLLKEAKAQMEAFFAQKLTHFDLPYTTKGSPFYQQVWGFLATIPYGSTLTYQEVATALNNPRATRAVGSANKKNPLPILLPCHRVTRKGSNIGGNYSLGGITTQIKLLSLENHGAL